MFARLFSRSRPVATLKVGSVRKLDNVFVVVVAVADGIATVRNEDDRTNSTYTVLVDWLN